MAYDHYLKVIGLTKCLEGNPTFKTHKKRSCSTNSNKYPRNKTFRWLQVRRSMFELVALVTADPIQTDGRDPLQYFGEDEVNSTQTKLNTVAKTILLATELGDKKRLAAARRLMRMYSGWVEEKGFTLPEQLVEASLVEVLQKDDEPRRRLDIGEVQPFEERRTPCAPVKFATHVGIVSVQSCRSLRDAIDEKIPGPVCGDTKQDWAEREAKQHMTPEEWSDVQKLLEFHGFSAFSEYAIKARRWTCDPEQPNNGINVHLDHHAKVLQLALNKDFEGGELFYQDDQRKCTPRREVGMCIVHDNTVAHGVTPVTSGGRYALYFLVDEKNRKI